MEDYVECYNCGEPATAEFGGLDYCEGCRVEIEEDYDPRHRALAVALEVSPMEIDDQSNNSYKYGREWYKVYTDDEAESAAKEKARDYIIEHYINALPDHLSEMEHYIDLDDWTEDEVNDNGVPFWLDQEDNVLESYDPDTGESYNAYRFI